jgi:hypothetical protein
VRFGGHSQKRSFRVPSQRRGLPRRSGPDWECGTSTWGGPKGWFEGPREFGGALPSFALREKFTPPAACTSAQATNAFLMPSVTPVGTYDAITTRTHDSDVCAVRRQTARNAHRLEAGRPVGPVPGCPRLEGRDPPPARYATGRPLRSDAINRRGQANVVIGGPRRDPAPNANELPARSPSPGVQAGATYTADHRLLGSGSATSRLASDEMP